MSPSLDPQTGRRIQPTWWSWPPADLEEPVWQPAIQDLQLQNLDQVITPTLKAYAQFLLWQRDVPDPTREPLLYRTISGLRQWLIEDILPASSQPVADWQISTPAIVRFAISRRLTDLESDALKQYCIVGERKAIDISPLLESSEDTFESTAPCPIDVSDPCPKSGAQQRTLFSGEETPAQLPRKRHAHG